MSRELTNRSIESFIANMKEDFVPSTEDLNFLRQYDKCQDAGLNEKVVFDRVWRIAMDMYEGNKAEESFQGNCLVTHGGSGKAITSAPEGISFHVFNDDYYCHEITKRLTSGRISQNFMRYDFGTIAEYFYVKENTSLPSYDLVISHAPRQCPLAELDSNPMMAKVAEKDARVYFAVRAFDFLSEDGTLLVIVPREDYKRVHDKIIEVLHAKNGLGFYFTTPSSTGDEFILKYERL